MNDLPAINEPLVLADGTRIDPATGNVEGEQVQSDFIEVPDGVTAQNIVGQTMKRVIDLPEPPSTMNAVGIVLMYIMYGLSPQEVAIATKLTVEQVENIRQLESYKLLEAEIVKSILTVDSENVKAILAKGSHAAALRVVNLVNSADPTIQLNAAKDLLNRTGHTSAEDRARDDMREALNIVVTIKDEKETRPTIDVTGD